MSAPEEAGAGPGAESEAAKCERLCRRRDPDGVPSASRAAGMTGPMAGLKVCNRQAFARMGRLQVEANGQKGKRNRELSGRHPET